MDCCSEIFAGMPRPPLPLFTSVEDAEKKIKMALDLWNTRYASWFHFYSVSQFDKECRDPSKMVQAYTNDSIWRNHAEIVDFLNKK